MKKTKSHIGKILLTTIALLLLSVPLMQPASAIVIDALPWASVYVDPFRVQGNAGEDVTIHIMIENITGLFSFQIGFTFDPATVDCLSVEEGGFLSNNGAHTLLAFPGSINNVAGVVVPYGWSLLSVPQAKTGNGILMNATFHMETTGYSDVHLANPIMMYQDGSTQIELNVVDYYSAVVDSGEYVVKIVGNAQEEMSYIGSFSAHNVSKISEVINSILYEGQLKFSVTGYAVGGNSFAYFNVTIPKSMMWCDISSEWVVMRGDVLQGSRIVGGNDTHTTIYLEFTYGAHDTTQIIKIKSTDIVPEFSSMFFAILLMLATVAAAIFGKMTWSVKRKS